MTKFILLFTTLLVTACSDTTLNECTIEKVSTITQTDQTGIVLLPSNRMFITFPEISNLYQDTMACVGMTAPPPEVQFTSFYQLFFGGDPADGVGGGAVYIGTAQRIVVNTDNNDDIPQTCDSQRELLTHEYVHHILRMNDIVTASRQHNPTFFSCIVENTTD